MRRFIKKQDGLETVEFAIIFMVFFVLTIFLVQVCLWFFNSLTVNAMLSDASQRASARGGLTVDVNNNFINSLPESVCGNVQTTDGVASCSNNNTEFTSDICDLASGDCDEDVTANDCADNATVGSGDECTKFGDIIKLHFSYDQPWIINYGCLLDNAKCGTGALQPLNFKQSQAVGSQSLIGQNKEVTP